jgi:3-isopropylmalate/(R)-2-methylmalate dehydratase small subunit
VGKAWTYGDDVNTDLIIPARYLNTSDPAALAAHCMEDADGGRFVREHAQGDLIVGGRNFGCGSSREHAPQAIQKHGFKAVVAENFAEIFFGNCTTLGIPCLNAGREEIARIAAAIEKDPKTEIVVDLVNSEIRFGGQRAKATIREAARDALVNGRWDAIGELLDGLPAARATAAKLPYLAA